MKLKKILPVVLLVVMAIITIFINRFNSNKATKNSTHTKGTTPQLPLPRSSVNDAVKLDRTTSNLFFTKHAKCRMKCRYITQREVKDILINGTVNYGKCDLHNPKGPTYALEGVTKDRQRVRIIFAPKKQHLTVVTVIDLENEFECNCT